MTTLTPETVLDLLRICHERIVQAGAHAQVIIKMLGQWGDTNDKELYPGGPLGTICMYTLDKKKLLVEFGAAKLITHLEDLRDAEFTDRPGN